MKKTNIAIIGAMKAVNTKVARNIADETGFYYFDSDEYIEYMERLKIGLILADHSIEYFLKLEEQHVKSVKDFEKSVLGMSGTVILNKNNLEKIKDNCYVVLLTADEKKTEERIKNDKNFLLNKFMMKNIKVVDKKVKEAAAYADLIINTTNAGPLSVAKQIIQHYNEEN